MNQPLITIMIPTLASRTSYLKRLLTTLYFQIDLLNAVDDVEILTFVDNGEQTTGAKRNWLVNNAKGEYVCFHDDDDMPTDVYVKKQLEVAKSGMDCGEFRGLYFINGKYDRPFIHSIRYDKWDQDATAYYRCTNHLNGIKKSILIQFPYPDKTVGEDGVQSMEMKNAKILKTEYAINETLYLYYDRTKI
jgi:glycosyltransferase involved in cell wall biosynthesis